MNLASHVSSLVAAADAADAASAPDAPAGAPPTGAGTSGAESASGAGASDAPPSPAAEPTPEAASAPPTTHDLLREKLAKVREERQARRLEAEARATREAARREAEAARADREAAAAEKAKVTEGLRAGSFLDTLKALGKDPKEVFDEMTREAVQAGTPEAQIAKLREAFDRQISEHRKELEQLRAERAQEQQARERAGLESRFREDFVAVVAEPDFEALREEYGDGRLLGFASAFRDNPDGFQAEARRLNVRLSQPAAGFTMREILHVLKAAQDAHEQEKSQRRAKKTPAAPQVTVNGTAEKRNAGVTTIGNELASAQASGAKAQDADLPVERRIRERVSRLANG